MLYQLGPLRQFAGQMTVELEAEAPPGTGAVVTGPVRGTLHLANTDSGIAVRGTLLVRLELECGRCLKIFEDTIEIEVNEICALRQVDDPEAYAESEDEPSQIPILSGDELDLTELVRQLIAMNLPLRPLCRDDCPGLCLRCGKDLNEGPCECSKPEPDSRWAALKNLKF